jgi:hypothetical protein
MQMPGTTGGLSPSAGVDYSQSLVSTTCFGPIDPEQRKGMDREDALWAIQQFCTLLNPQAALGHVEAERQGPNAPSGKFENLAGYTAGTGTTIVIRLEPLQADDGWTGCSGNQGLSARTAAINTPGACAQFLLQAVDDCQCPLYSHVTDQELTYGKAIPNALMVSSFGNTGAEFSVAVYRPVCLFRRANKILQVLYDISGLIDKQW